MPGGLAGVSAVAAGREEAEGLGAGRRRGSADGARVQVSPAAHLSGTAAAAQVGSQRGPGPRGPPPPSPRTSRLRSLLSRPPPPVLSVVFQRGAFLPPPPTPGIWGDA